jgi:hypothetical protein
VITLSRVRVPRRFQVESDLGQLLIKNLYALEHGSFIDNETFCLQSTTRPKSFEALLWIEFPEVLNIQRISHFGAIHLSEPVGFWPGSLFNDE